MEMDISYIILYQLNSYISGIFRIYIYIYMAYLEEYGISMGNLWNSRSKWTLKWDIIGLEDFPASHVEKPWESRENDLLSWWKPSTSMGNFPQMDLVQVNSCSLSYSD